MKYRIYIDEVGNPDLESSDNPNHRFLSLTGVILELGYVASVLHPQMEQLKNKYFGAHPDEPVILHRKEMVNAKPPFEALRNKIDRDKFDGELLDLLVSWDYKVISVCIDKRTHKNKYSTWRYNPYHYCLAILLERFVFFLEGCNSKGDVMSESRAGKEDIKLKESFAKLFKNGTEYVAHERFQKVFTSLQLKVKPKSNNISGLQLADIIAHPSRNEILVENGIGEVKLGVFAKRIVEILKDKYYQNEGKIIGPGKKFI